MRNLSPEYDYILGPVGPPSKSSNVAMVFGTSDTQVNLSHVWGLVVASPHPWEVFPLTETIFFHSGSLGEGENTAPGFSISPVMSN